MKYTLQDKVLHILKVIVAWILAYAALGFFRFYGMNGSDNPGRLWSTQPGAWFSQILLAAVITGVLYGTVDQLIQKPRYQRWSYWKVLIVKGSLHFVIIVITISLLTASRLRLGIIETDQLPEGYFNVFVNKSFQVFVVFFFVTSWILNAYQEVNQKFGKGVLLEMLTGKYHRPKESERIFMFIDLKSSVMLAETLGHIRYSYLLQDAYFDLNVVMEKYRAKIYQYVGDQVVLHWNYADGLAHNNCVRCFFAFTDRLEKRRDYYEKRYGLMPFFKGACHAGSVTVAEVGIRKRSIAFHGDTVNTTSRIHDQCNNYNQRFLVSKELLELLPDRSELQTVYIGDHVLRGRHSKMEIYGITGISSR